MSKVRRIARGSAGVVLAAMVGLVSTARADEAPPIPKEVTVIGGEQLKKMIDAKEKFLLVDARIGREYKEGHIPGAIHVYDKEMEGQKGKFPADKGHLIVFYCNGYPKCPRSANAATIALKWGYRNIYLYKAGIPEWEQKGYPIERE
jgi:rhodanese-related sulfurtransferase